MTWKAEYFSTIGYLSVALWVGAVLLWLIYWLRPARPLCNLALGLAVAGFVCAKINSETYVNHIQLDRTEELARQAALEEAKQRALIEGRGEEVAQIRFAEDGAGDFLDRAGMDEADLKYFESQGGFGVPEWKKEKKTRTGGGSEDESLDASIGGEGVISGVESATMPEEEEKVSVVMSQDDMVLANRFDLMNLRVSKWLIVLGVVVLLLDYLRRANIYGKASRPVPLPSSWLNALTPMPPLVVSKKRYKNHARGELARLAKRGDSFLYLTDDLSRVAKLPESMGRFPLVGGEEDLIRVDDAIDDKFIFESVWYGRSSFAVDSSERSLQLLEFCLEQLSERKAARAKVRQTAHLVWDLDTPLPNSLRKPASQLAKATGFSILLLRDKGEARPDTENQPQPAPTGDLVTS